MIIEDKATDARPILYKKDYGMTGLDVVLGAKIDTIYDLLDKLNGSTDELNVIASVDHST